MHNTAVWDILCPAVFQQSIDMYNTANYPSCLCCYIDGIVVTEVSKQKHLQNLG